MYFIYNKSTYVYLRFVKNIQQMSNGYDRDKFEKILIIYEEFVRRCSDMVDL